MTSAPKEPKGSKEVEKTPQPIDPQKPVIKEFVDKNQEILNFLEIRLPHVPYCLPRMICVYQSKDKTEVAYRVNWIKKISDRIVTTNEIKKSQYVKLAVKPNAYEIVSIN